MNRKHLCWIVPICLLIGFLIGVVTGITYQQHWNIKAISNLKVENVVLDLNETELVNLAYDIYDIENNNDSEKKE